MNLQCIYAYPNQTNDIDIFIEVGNNRWYSKKDIQSLLPALSLQQLEFRMHVEDLGELEP